MIAIPQETGCEALSEDEQRQVLALAGPVRSPSLGAGAGGGAGTELRVGLSHARIRTGGPQPRFRSHPALSPQVALFLEASPSVMGITATPPVPRAGPRNIPARGSPLSSWGGLRAGMRRVAPSRCIRRCLLPGGTRKTIPSSCICSRRFRIAKRHSEDSEDHLFIGPLGPREFASAATWMCSRPI